MNKNEIIFRAIRHDLGNKFSHILGFFSIYNEGEREEENQDTLKMIGKRAEKSAQDAWNVLNEMLSWGSKDSMQQKSFSLFEVCNEIINFFDGHYPETINFSVENAIPEYLEVFTDPIAVKTIMRNLIGNAIKFSQPNSRIRIAVEPVEIPGEKIMISIQDNGIGIPEEMQEKIFLPTEGKVRKDTFGNKSTGLGLVLIKDLIDALGEEIFLQSEEGKGTKFFFTLPTALWFLKGF